MIISMMILFNIPLNNNHQKFCLTDFLSFRITQKVSKVSCLISKMKDNLLYSQNKPQYIYYMVTQKWARNYEQSLLFNLFKAFYYFESCCPLFCYSPKRCIFLYKSATCSELPSHISTMNKTIILYTTGCSFCVRLTVDVYTIQYTCIYHLFSNRMLTQSYLY